MSSTNDSQLFELIDMNDMALPVVLYRNGCESFPVHWHDKIELLLITEGAGVFKCGSETIQAKANDVVVANCNELHQGVCSDGCKLIYHCIIIDVSLIQSKFIDDCVFKYLKAISSNLILFQNKIACDPYLVSLLMLIWNEYLEKKPYYELAVKANIQVLFTYLLRNYVKDVLSKEENHIRTTNLLRFNSVLEYIKQNYKKPITLDELCRHVSISKHYFCHLFKELTGNTVTAFINEYRIDKAVELLQNTEKNVCEAAYECGFTDINYFGRQFKKQKGYSPSLLIKQRNGKTEQ